MRKEIERGIKRIMDKLSNKNWISNYVLKGDINEI